MNAPEFCPYSGCDAHLYAPNYRWFVLRGTYTSGRAGRTQRYRCRLCGRSFSDTSFSIDFHAHRRIDYRQLLLLVASCTGLRQIGRVMELHRGLVANRIMRLARQAIYLQAALMRFHHLEEPVVADGLRSFWISQYVPNEYLVAVGKRTRFLYAYTAYSLRRSGRMTEEQRSRREQLEEQFRASPTAIEEGFGRVVEELTRLCGEQGPGVLVLHTDEHHSYPGALSKHGGWEVLKRRHRAVHLQTSSEEPRTQWNPLAAVNQFDRSVRNDLAEHVRETIRFARSVGPSQERFAIHQHWYNFRKRACIDEAQHVTCTHVELLGYEEELLKRAMRGFFTRRAFYTRSPPWGVMRDVWLRTQRTPFSLRPDYLPAYLVA